MNAPEMFIVAGPPRSFALETTLRSKVTFEQARLAKSLGFNVFLVYVALDGFDRHLERVKRRAILGGHAASESTLRRIHESSMANLPVALDPAQSGIGDVRVFDNRVGFSPHLTGRFQTWNEPDYSLPPGRLRCERALSGPAKWPSPRYAGECPRNNCTSKCSGRRVG
jgi:predicted ABC-type ATPase